MTEVFEQTACPICTAETHRRFSTQQDRALMICSRCRHVFWEHMPDEQYLQEYYSKTYSDTHHQRQVQQQNTEYFKRHLRELAEFLAIDFKSCRIIDFGCSFPYLLIEAKKLGFAQVIGVEWSECARQTGEAEGIMMLTPDQFDKQVEPNSVDIIRFSHALEHSRDPATLLRRAVRTLRNRGLAYITQPNLPVFAYEECDCEIPDAVWPEHLHFFSILSLRELFQKSDLKLKKIFTHQNAEGAVRRYINHLDTRYAAEQLQDVAALGDGKFGQSANYPLYAGENSVAFAVCENRRGRTAWRLFKR